MFTTKYLSRLVACFLFGILCAPLHAKDLIRTLYHADFTPDTDDEIPRFTLDGELGVLLNSGNTSAASIKAALNADHETQHWSNVYFAELLTKKVAPRRLTEKLAHNVFTPLPNLITSLLKKVVACLCMVTMKIIAFLATSTVHRWRQAGLNVYGEMKTVSFVIVLDPAIHS
jgi:hypothetical protein